MSAEETTSLTRVESIETRTLDDTDADLSWLEDPSRYEGIDAEERAKYEAQDRARLESYGRDWWTIGIDARAVVYVHGTRQEITSGGLWGIESDSDQAYLDEIAKEQLDELHTILRELGFEVAS